MITTSTFLLLIGLAVPFVSSQTTKRPNAKQNYAIRFTHLDTHANPKYVTLNSTPHGPDMNLFYELKTRVTAPHMHMKLRIRPKDSRRSEFISVIDRWVDVCAFLADQSIDYFVGALYSAIIYSDGNHFFRECPVEPDVYYIRTLDIDTSRLKLGLPLSMEFDFQFDIYNGTASGTNQLSHINAFGVFGKKQYMERKQRRG